MSFLTKFYLLQYKNWKLRIRKKLVTAAEILIPIFICLLVLCLRVLMKVVEYPNATYFTPYSVDKFPRNLTESLTSNGTTAMGLAFTPNTTLTNSIMLRVGQKLASNMQANLTSQFVPIIRGFEDEDSMVEFLVRDIDAEFLYLAGIVFEDPEKYKDDVLPFDIAYTVRPRHNLREVEGISFEHWQTSFQYPGFPLPGPRGGTNRTYSPNPSYYEEGFLTIQRALHYSIITHLNPTAQPELENIKLTMERYPYPPYNDDKFSTLVLPFLPLLLMLSLMMVALMIPKEVGTEKEKKLKETMKMMSMSNWLQWVAWFFKYFIFLIIITFSMAFILCPPFEVPPSVAVLPKSSFQVVWLFLILYALSLITYCFMVSVFFNKAIAAASGSGIMYFLLFIINTGYTAVYDKWSLGAKLSVCLNFNTALAFGFSVVAKHEGTEVGAQWHNIAEPVTLDDNLPLGHVMLMLVIDSILHILIMWYVEAVFPGAYGVPQKPYFFIQSSYWFGTEQQVYDMDNDNSEKVTQSEFFERDPKDCKAGIEIKGLCKTFRANGTTKTAVNDLNLNMYEGQITALLGHNGAGKTTTMFMLTGFIPPSQGTALVNGYDIRKDIASVRSSLGLCPQHDILFDELTVEEHLYFFAKLKKCPSHEIKQQIDYYLETLDLDEKRHAFAGTLSGGQKRKLSVGIALIGDSKIVILDEPTSGMDPSARRHMWDVLQEQRKGRTMILTTHFMDEADHLGDRIAIMADGVVQCYGTSLFLKKKYGAGYHMVMTKRNDCDVEKVNKLLLSHVETAVMKSNIGAELTFILPDDYVSAFPDMFAELENRKDELGILGFGASVTTMEEVFIKVGEGNTTMSLYADENRFPDEQTKYNPAFIDDEGGNELSAMEMKKYAKANEDQFKVVGNVTKNKGFALFNQQYKAMFLKRVIYTMRNKILTLSQVLLPMIFTAITIILIRTGTLVDPKTKKLPLNVDIYRETLNIYSNGLPGSISENLSSLYPLLLESEAHTIRLVTQPRAEILKVAEQSIKQYNFRSIIAADFNSSNTEASSDINILFNAQTFHSAPVGLVYADTTLLQHFVNKSYSFKAAIQPLPQTTISEINEAATSTFNENSFYYSANVMFGVSFLASSFVVFLIVERERKIKHSQIVSGVKWYNFWLSTFTWDFLNFIIPALLTIALFAIGEVENLTDVSDGKMQPLYVAVLLTFFGCACLPSMYMLQYLFRGAAPGYVAITLFNLLTGVVPQITFTILTSSQNDEIKDFAEDQLDWFFLTLLPNYNLGKGISDIYNNYAFNELCFNKLPDVFEDFLNEKLTLDEICDRFKSNGETFPCCKDNCGDLCLNYQEDYLAMEAMGIGRSLLFLLIQSIIIWTVVIMIDTEVLTKLFYIIRPKVIIAPGQDRELQEDEDVKAEMQKVLHKADEMQAENSQVMISGLTKYFSNHRAVDGVYLSIPEGECFGLLGVNGAGKTTTFKMLTGDETISGGTAYMNGYNIRTDIHNVQKSIGYCPQFDALIDQMTGEETLYMYARLRGIPEKSIPTIVQDLISALLLDKHKKKLTKDYSGGNKRKLSTAIALIGDPPIVFLDEPTTGMDPVARRMLWQALTKVRESGKTLILTSHSMEECEALCTRMAIMVNGRYRCLGSTQHLKNKFGAGYTLIARVSYPSDGSLPDIQSVQRFVEENFPKSILKDKHQNLVQYYIDKGCETWASVFRKLEDSKNSLQIEDYSVSQTTLEQVFLNFARAQIPPNIEETECNLSWFKTGCICLTPEYVVKDGTNGSDWNSSAMNEALLW